MCGRGGMGAVFCPLSPSRCRAPLWGLLEQSPRRPNAVSATPSTRGSMRGTVNLPSSSALEPFGLRLSFGTEVR